MKLHPWEPDLRSLVDRIDQGDVDLQPDFQRQEVWSTNKKKKLIDTIIREWSIPPIHLVVLPDGKLEVLDGQQRLASIRDFVHNQFSVDGKVTPYDERVAALHGQFYSKLSSADRRKIDQYTLRCFRITDYQPEEPSELFYRLNQPTMLTAGEQRNALFGPAREQLKELVSYFEALGNDKETIGFSNARLAYDDILARLLFFVEAGGFGEKSTEGRISERFRISNPFALSVYQRCERSIELFSECINNSERTRLNKASVLSWLLFFSRFEQKYPEGNLLQDFIDAELGRMGTNEYLGQAVSLFRDRASLRVTDVSSVVYRDVVLCFLYLMHGQRTSIPKVSGETVYAIRQLMEVDAYSFEEAVRRAVDIDEWSVSL